MSCNILLAILFSLERQTRVFGSVAGGRVGLLLDSTQDGLTHLMEHLLVLLLFGLKHLLVLLLFGTHLKEHLVLLLFDLTHLMEHLLVLLLFGTHLMEHPLVLPLFLFDHAIRKILQKRFNLLLHLYRTGTFIVLFVNSHHSGIVSDE